MRLLSSMLPLLIAGLSIAGTGCQKAPSGSQKPEQDEHEKQVAALAQKRLTHEKELAAMNVTQLARELQAESVRGLEPFNSMSYSAMVSRGRDVAAQLRAELRDSTRNSFLGLLALRAMDSTQYAALAPAFRADVLLDALRTSRFFNAWGMPHTGWEDAAKALIAEGRAAEPGLTRLLDDRRPAPMWGSEDVAEYQRYGYRVRDYAWAMLREIRGEKGSIPLDALARDSLIARIQRPGR
jgi:hypothetical protein